MKKIKYFIGILALAASVASCEGFLTKVPETSLAPDTYFSSKDAMELWVNRYYSLILESAADLAEVNSDVYLSRSLSAIQKGTRTASSNSWSTSTFAPLRYINYQLENDKGCAEDVRAPYDGAAYFFRAYFYYQMVRQYGDMPWYDRVIGSADEELLKKPRDPRGYVMMKALEDCDKAYELLPEKWTSDPTYHVSKAAALLLKSRIALFEGTFRKYHEGTEYVPQDVQEFDGQTISSTWFLEQAADAASKLLGTRTLYAGSSTTTAYRDFFLLEDADPSESILARRYSADAAISHGLQFDQKNGRRSATVRMVNHYLTSTGKSISTVAGWETLDYFSQFQGRDPRMAQTLHGPAYIQVGESAHASVDFERTWSGYRSVKYVGDNSHETASGYTIDFNLMRYPEALLNYAEAKAELGTLTDSDVQATIDVIRSRVGMVLMKTVPTTVDPIMAEYYPNAKGTQLAAILEVRRERTVELFAEGFRQWDLLRWGEGKWLCPKTTNGFQGIYVSGLGEIDLDKDGKADLLLYNKTKPSSISATISVDSQIDVSTGWSLSEGTKGYLCYFGAEDYVWDEGKDYLWPIPANQIVVTEGALTQNPGWTDSTM